MSKSTVRVLHVEDDRSQQRLIARHLEAIEECAFSITCVESEDGAMRAFESNGFDFVILDYSLTQGNGLSCLQNLRKRDSCIPVLVISGVITPELTAELVYAGADDCLNKLEMNRQDVIRAVRDALMRAESLKQRIPGEEPDSEVDTESLFAAMLRRFAAQNGRQLLKELSDVESAAHRRKLTAGQLHFLFNKVCDDLQPFDPMESRQLLRPLLLDLFTRLYGDSGDTQM